MQVNKIFSIIWKECIVVSQAKSVDDHDAKKNRKMNGFLKTSEASILELRWPFICRQRRLRVA